jgi:Fur family transcriptional regulator, ferric uptake regulator
VRQPTPGREERRILSAYIKGHRLKRSRQREVILEVFLRSRRHLSVEELLRLVRTRRPDVGRTTVYRTLKLFQAAGLAQELLLHGQTHFEPEYKRRHHDHFVCNHCGDIIEFQSPEIERLQGEAAARIGFAIEGHRHQIFGRCRRCASRSRAG